MSQVKRILQLGRLLLVATLSSNGIYLNPSVLAAEITVIEQGNLFYLKGSSEVRIINAPDKQPIFSGTNIFGESAQVEAGDKGARFRYQCKRGKPAKAPITLEPGARKAIKEFCPNEPGPSLDLRDRIVQSSDVDPEIPRLISPRYTLLRHPRPFLAWRGVKGVTRYDVTLYKMKRNERKRVWSKPVLATGSQIERIAYPDAEAALQPQVAYKLVIQACFPASPMPKCVSSEDEERSNPLAIYRYSSTSSLLNKQRPTLFWKALKNAIPGKTVYTVMLYDIDHNQKQRAWLNFHTVKATGNSIETMDYPENELGLKPEVTYKLVAIACDGDRCVSSEGQDYIDRYPPHPREQFPISGLTFELMNQHTEDIKFKEGYPIENQSIWMGNYETGFDLANTYYEHRLYAEAIPLLESFEIRNLLTQSIIGVSRKLRCAYAKVGLYDLALDSLERSVQVTSARKPNDDDDFNIEVVRQNSILLSTLRRKQEKSFNDFCPKKDITLDAVRF